jgi:ABC-type glycerol-3-phosphate transport system substrate-binding protein
MAQNRLSRRNFLQLSSAAAGAAVLAACAAPTPQVVKETVEVEKVVKETVQVEKSVEKVVEKTVEKTVVVEKQVTALPPTPGPAKLEMWAWCCLSVADEAAKAAGFYEKFPGSKVNLVQGGDYWSKITPAAAAGTLPDGVMALNTQVHQWYDKRIIEDITDVVAGWPDFRKNHEPISLNQLSIVGGKLLGMPFSLMVDGIGYISAPFEDAGIADPEALVKTWDDYYAVWGKAGKDGEVRFDTANYFDPSFIGALTSWCLANMVRSTGLGLFDKDRKLRINDTAWKEGFKVFKTAHEKKLDWVEGSLDYPVIYANILSKKIAGFLGHCGYILGVLGNAFKNDDNTWKKDHPWYGKVRWTLYPSVLPGGKQHAGPAVGEVLCLTDNGIQNGNAYAWGEWVRSACCTVDGVRTQYMNSAGLSSGATKPVLWLPAREDEKIMNLTIDPLGDMKVIKVVTEQTKQWPDVNWIFTPADGDVFGILNEYVPDMLSGKMTVEGGFDQTYQRAVKEVLPKYPDAMLSG